MADPNTPSMQQYLKAKAEHPDCVILFRMGDFYETFFEDAIEVSKLLDIALTSRNKDDPNPIPMAGVPHHAVGSYMTRLVEAGRRVAVCEQMEDPKLARGLVRREVVRVVTPGVLLDSEMSDPAGANHLVAVARDQRGFGVVALDASTGDFTGLYATGLADLRNALGRLLPREIVCTGAEDPELAGVLDETRALRSIPKAPGPLSAVVPDARIPDSPMAIREAGERIMAYVQQTHGALLATVRPLRVVTAGTHVLLPQTTVRNLELVSTGVSGRAPGTLLHFLDRTRTPLGARLLREWLLSPLTRIEAIALRQARVAALVGTPIVRQQIRDDLRGIVDVTRVLTRCVAGGGNARDLVALARAVRTVEGIDRAVTASGRPDLTGVATPDPALSPLATDLLAVFVDEPPTTTSEGGMVRTGVRPDLDEALDLALNGRRYIAEYEAQQRQRTGISTLKVRYNRVFGYTIEVSRSQVARVPADYERRQTLASAERYATRELSELAAQVLSAEEDARTIEADVFESRRSAVAALREALQDLADRIAMIDVLTTLADVAQTQGYCRPTLTEHRAIRIRNGRHPIVEASLPPGTFVPNDYEVDGDTVTLDIITGPNMAGKSTVMRQVAIITILAQMGAFVPADAAEIGIADAVFCRVGARDELASGRSTFMVEMSEVAEVLARATDRSLVILDEIGRGTSTFDGVAIAWAVAEYIQAAVGCRTLFATHYHELTDLVRALPRTRNLSIAVKEWGNEVLFLRKLIEGPASKSYGIQVARLAGLPDAVLMRAREVLANLEDSELDVTGVPVLARARRGRTGRGARDQLDMFGIAPSLDDKETT